MPLVPVEKKTNKLREVSPSAQQSQPSRSAPRTSLGQKFGEGFDKALQGGIPPYGIFKNPDVLPGAGQVAGGMLGGFGGAVGGAAIGQAAKQGMLKFLGEPVELGKAGRAMAKDAATTAIVEGLTRVPAHLLFRLPRAEETLTKLAGPALGKAKEAIANISDADVTFGANKAQVVNFIETRLNKLVDISGGPGTTMSKFLRDFKKIPGDTIPARKLIEFESAVGDSLQDVFGTVKKRTLNRAGAEVRRYVSGIVDDLAEQAGFKSFKTLSSEVSKARAITGKGVPRTTQEAIARAFSGIGPRLAAGSVAGALTYQQTQDPVMASLVSSIPFLGSSPNVQRLLFKLVEKSGLGRAATLGATQGARKLTGQ